MVAGLFSMGNRETRSIPEGGTGGGDQLQDKSQYSPEEIQHRSQSIPENVITVV